MSYPLISDYFITCSWNFKIKIKHFCFLPLQCAVPNLLLFHFVVSLLLSSVIPSNFLSRRACSPGASPRPSQSPTCVRRYLLIQTTVGTARPQHAVEKKNSYRGKKTGRKTWKYHQRIGERLSFSSCKPHVNTVHIPKSTHTHTQSHTRTHTNKHFLHLSGVGSTQSTAEPGSLLLVSSIETAEVKHHPLCGLVKTCAYFV